MKLSDKQREILEQGATGTCTRFVWRWTLGRDRFAQSVTREVNTLLKKGLMKAAYYSGGQASASPTEEGRAALKQDEKREIEARFKGYNANPHVEES